MMNIIFLSMFNCYSNIIISELVICDLCIVAVASPNSIITFKNAIL